MEEAAERLRSLSVQITLEQGAGFVVVRHILLLCVACVSILPCYQTAVCISIIT